MYVCICSAVTDGQIREAADDGARDLRDLSRRLGVATGCGRCVAEARRILDHSRTGGDDATDPGPDLVPVTA